MIIIEKKTIPDSVVNNIDHSMIEVIPLCCLWNVLGWPMEMVILVVLVDHCMAFQARQILDPN